MRKITIILLFFLFGLGSCEEYQMVEYGKGGEIDFLGHFYSGRYGPYWDDDVKYLAWEKNFGMNKQGDSLLVDTVIVGVKIMGLTSATPRRVTLKVNAPAEYGLEVSLPETYYLPADTGRTHFNVIVKRPPTYNEYYTAELVFDYASSDFTAGTFERQVFKLKARDAVSLKLWGCSAEEWEADPIYYFGEWSETKCRFMITILGCISYPDWYDTDEFYDAIFENVLYEALKTYKSNPANRPLLDENTGEWIEFPDMSEF